MFTILSILHVEPPNSLLGVLAPPKIQPIEGGFQRDRSSPAISIDSQRSKINYRPIPKWQVRQDSPSKREKTPSHENAWKRGTYPKSAALLSWCSCRTLCWAHLYAFEVANLHQLQLEDHLSTDSAADAVVDVCGLWRVDHPNDLQLDA
jgi:hypothetical protein